MAEREAAVVWVSLYIMRTLWKGSRRRGFASYSRPEEAQRGEQVLIRAHGVAREVYERLAERGAAVTDASCPKVKGHPCHRQPCRR